MAEREVTNPREMDQKLKLAIDNGDLQSVDYLVKNGVNITGRDVLGFLPIHRAISTGYENIAEFLLDNGADPNAICQKVKYMYTCLHLACDKKMTGLIKSLLRRGANMYAKNVDGLMPIHISIDRNDKEAIEIFWHNEFDMKTKIKDGDTLLLYAVSVKSFSMIAKILSYDMDVKDKRNQEAFDYLIYNFQPKIENKLGSVIKPGYDQHIYLFIQYGFYFKLNNKNHRSALITLIKEKFVDGLFVEAVVRSFPKNIEIIRNDTELYQTIMFNKYIHITHYLLDLLTLS